MSRPFRRLVPVLALLALAAATLPARGAVGSAGGGAVDVSIWAAEVSIPGGDAHVEVVRIAYRGGEADVSTTPGASPVMGEELYGCVAVRRGRVGDATCGELTAAGATGAADLSAGRVRFTLPTHGRHSITVDLTLTATGHPEPFPWYELYAGGPLAELQGSVAASVGRRSSVTGSVTSTQFGGGRVGATRFGALAREVWAGVSGSAG